MENLKKYIIDWFLENSFCDIADIENSLDKNYFELGWIDSMQFINFIADIEDDFDISFVNDEFQNRKFATINGLVEIITEKSEGK